MLPHLPQCPRPLVVAFLLIGSLGSFIFGRELAVVARLAPAPLRAQMSAPSDQRAEVTMWGPFALAVGALGVAPPSVHPSVHPPKGSARQGGATAALAPLSHAHLSVSLPPIPGHEGAVYDKGKHDKGDQDTAEHHEGNQHKGKQDAGKQDEDNQDDGRGKASSWKADTPAPDGQQVSGLGNSPQGDQGDQGEQ